MSAVEVQVRARINREPRYFPTMTEAFSFEDYYLRTSIDRTGSQLVLKFLDNRFPNLVRAGVSVRSMSYGGHRAPS